jgi:hypothetical protein
MGKLKDTTKILEELKALIGKNGMVAFEHGFRRPTFKIDNYKYKCTMVSDKVMYGYKYYPATNEKRTCNYSLYMLNYSVLKGLIKSINNYTEYCKKEA